MNDILVVDDHPIIAKACRIVLEPMGVEEIISASTADAGYQAFVEREPDVSVIDLSLHGEEMAGISLIKRIRSYKADARILVFSMRSDRKSFFSAIEAGTTGYAIKDSPADEFTKAVEKTRLGRRYIDPQLALNLAFSKNAALSPREQRIINLLLEDSPRTGGAQFTDPRLPRPAPPTRLLCRPEGHSLRQPGVAHGAPYRSIQPITVGWRSPGKPANTIG